MPFNKHGLTAYEQTKRISLALCKVKGSSTGLVHAFMNDLVTVLPYGV